MRILQMCTRFVPGGIQRHVLDLTGWLRGQGHHVTLGGTRGLWVDETSDPDYLPIDLHNVAAEGGPLPRRLVRAVAAARTLRRDLKSRRIELIHAHESAPALVACLAALKTGIPLLVTYHGSAPERVREFGRIARIAADRVITPSHASADDLVAIGGLARSKVQVIGLGVEPVAAIAAAQRDRLRHALLGSGGRLIVLTVARLAHQKGIDILIEVARAVRVQDPAIRFVVVGDGPQRDEARAWAKAAALGDTLCFVGHSDAAHDYMAAADLFLLPSRWESLPITIVEALRQGLPVVATDTGGVRELVDATVGAVVPVGDVQALGDAVLALSRDEEARARLADAARRRSAEDRFSPPHIHALFEQAYAAAIRQRTPRR